jgi:hypothetical protein
MLPDKNMLIVRIICYQNKNMKTRDKIIIASVSISVVVTVAITLGVVLTKKDKPVDGNGGGVAPPPQQGDRCPANTVCVSEECKENPLEGKWRLVGGVNRDIKVMDDDEFEIYYQTTNPTGSDEYRSTSIAFGSTPVLIIYYRDSIDEVTGDRVISTFSTLRPYSDDYESYGPEELARYRYLITGGGPLEIAPGTSTYFPLAVIPPNSPDFQACVEIDEIDFAALCVNSTSGSCMDPDLPLFLEKIS